MTPRAEIPQDEALRLQLAAIAGNEPAESLVELRLFNNGPHLPRQDSSRGLRSKEDR